VALKEPVYLLDKIVFSEKKK